MRTQERMPPLGGRGARSRFPQAHLRGHCHVARTVASRDVMTHNIPHRMKRGLFLAATVAGIAWGTVALLGQWNNYARDAQHTAQSSVPAQALSRIRWSTPVDLAPQYSQGALLIHYGSPLLTATNTVIVPVKTGATGGFAVEAHDGTTGALRWSQATDYILPGGNNWTPVFGPAVTAQPRLYFPGVAGTVYYRDAPDSSSGAAGRVVFYGTVAYGAHPQAYNASIQINTPLTSDALGNIYFGFLVTKNNLVWPLYDSAGSVLTSGIARIDPSGAGSWVAVTTAAGDATMTQVVYNGAPAISESGGMVYVAVSNGSAGYLVALDRTSLAPLHRVRLKDPKSGKDAILSNNGSASPTIGPDGDVYYGVLEDPCCKENHDRGWLLHFTSTLVQAKTPGAFGWDATAAILPAAAVRAYQGPSPYLLVIKYNNYSDPGAGGNGQNRIAVLDPDGTEIDPVTGVTVMNEVLTVLGPTPNPKRPGVKEWCINSVAVDPVTRAVLANNEDGKLYRWDLDTNTLTQSVVLTAGIGEAYTPTVSGPDGSVYAINNATLFAVGN